jgi:hypothetical protein
MITSLSKKTPLIAIMSTRIDQNSTSSYLSQDLSDMLWTLWRIGATTIIAHPKEQSALTEALTQLHIPPSFPSDHHPILDRLHEERRTLVRENITDLLPWPKQIDIRGLPPQPINFDQIKLCFHDELIGTPNAFLIHYGPSHFDVSGYHHPISAISVPIGEALTALLIAQIPYADQSTHEQNIETCVIHLSSKGERLKGPWWPRLNHLMREV